MDFPYWVEIDITYALRGHGSCPKGGDMNLAQLVSMDLAHPAGSCQNGVNMDLGQLGGVQWGGHCANFK